MSIVISEGADKLIMAKLPKKPVSSLEDYVEQRARDYEFKQFGSVGWSTSYSSTPQKAEGEGCDPQCIAHKLFTETFQNKH